MRYFGFELLFASENRCLLAKYVFVFALTGKSTRNGEVCSVSVTARFAVTGEARVNDRCTSGSHGDRRSMHLFDSQILLKIEQLLCNKRKRCSLKRSPVVFGARGN